MDSELKTPKRRLPIMLTKERYNALKALSRNTGESMNVITRRALERELQRLERQLPRQRQ